jgi:hypothetical protein
MNKKLDEVSKLIDNLAKSKDKKVRVEFTNNFYRYFGVVTFNRKELIECLRDYIDKYRRE